MLTRDFSFNLPPEQIAQFPSGERGASRLMIIRRFEHTRIHDTITSLHHYLNPGTLLVLNNTRVRKARLYGVAETGGRVEFLLLERTGPDTWNALVSKAKKQRPGKVFQFDGQVRGRLGDGSGAIREIRFQPEIDEAYLETYGHIPLPPYIRREDAPSDAGRYQTVYARETGSAAAPTAGLHFTHSLIENLQSRGFRLAYVTLHVGVGTFLPVRTERVEDHRMHEEQYEISEETAELVTEARREGRDICAVGTTSVRTLESAWRDTELVPGKGSTSLFIYPPYRFQAVDRMLTNFHTPQSSLLMMVSAFAGWDTIHGAYEEAVEQGYRFFSYGDAMLIR